MSKKKKCTGPCGRELEENKDNFKWRHDRNKFISECKNCANKKRNEKNKNPEYRKCARERTKKWRENNKDNLEYKVRQKERDKKRYDKIKNDAEFKNHKKEYDKQHYQNIKAHKREKENKRRKNDPEFRLRKDTASEIRKGLKKYNLEKQDSTLNYINHTFSQLAKYLESLFKYDMRWDNKGTVWHIDHKVPRIFFFCLIEENKDKLNNDQIKNIIKVCENLINLQPLYKKENLEKNAKIIPEFAQELYESIKDKAGFEYDLLRDKLKESMI